MKALRFPTSHVSGSVIPCKPRLGSVFAPALAPTLACTMALLALQASPARAGAARAVPPPADFTALSGSRAGTCAALADPVLSAMGSPSLRRCAWSQRLEMLYWHDVPSAPNTCLPAPAIAWHRLGAGARAVLRPWSGSWRGQSMLAQNNGVEQAGLVWRQADGHWSAVLWRWRPSERIPTRNWQARHWKNVVQAVRAVDAANPAPPRTPLMMAWLDATNGKPRTLDGDAWRWVSEGSCLDMRSAGLGPAQLHLPYSRDDARLEQRSAMQVMLARRFPAAEWMRPFTLVEPAISGDRTGAKFLAVWKEGAVMQGQLWIPLRDKGGIVRARIASELPAAEGAQEEAAKARAALIERELGVLAHAWEARHE
ncbi:hypothetical protein IM543_13445 [Massilia sp. UMI-21]|nr:hypothetical protein IM543_13445 [Massilia sp. UMI-21]